MGSGSVRIDVEAILVRVEASLVQSQFDALGLGCSVWPWSCRVVGIAGVSVADHFGDDLRSACLCVLIFLKNKDARSVTHDESASVGVEREGCIFRVLCPGECLGVGETGYSERNGGVLAASGYDCVSVTVFDGSVSLADGIGGGCAGCDHIDCRSLGVMLDCDVTGSDVGNHGRNEQR